MEAGKDLGLKPFGIRAMNSLRVENHINSLELNYQLNIHLTVRTR